MPNYRIVHFRQRGFALVFTLLILVVIVLTAQAMLIMMRGGVTTAGNIAFRQAAVRVADVAAADGFQWVNTQTSSIATLLNNTNLGTTPGYYSKFDEADPNCSTTATFSPQSYGFENTGSNCAIAYPSQVSGYNLYYVIHRMANTSNAACPGAGCSGPSVTSTCPPGTSQDPSSPNYCKAGVTNTYVYYRITVKVVGSRHNSRYIQTFVY